MASRRGADSDRQWGYFENPLRRGRARALSPALLFGAYLSLTPTDASAQEIELTATFNQHFDRVLLSATLTSTYQEITVHLSPNGEISHSERHYANGTLIVNRGEDIHLGKRDKLKWRVVSKESLINVNEFKSFRRAILVTVHDGACRAQIDFELKAGVSDNEYTLRPDNVPAVARAVRADKVSCSIAPSSQGRAFLE